MYLVYKKIEFFLRKAIVDFHKQNVSIIEDKVFWECNSDEKKLKAAENNLH